MPDDEFERLLDEAEGLTKAELDARISSLTRLTDEEIASLFPKKPDKEKLVELMGIVRGAASENAKRKQIIDGITQYAGVVVTLLGKFVEPRAYSITPEAARAEKRGPGTVRGRPRRWARHEPADSSWPWPQQRGSGETKPAGFPGLRARTAGGACSVR